MRFLIAGALAAGVSWTGNRAALKLIGTKGIVVLTPLIEESAKTGSAFLIGSPLLLTHAAFGMVEGVYDSWEAGMKGITAGLTSLLGHSFYGYVANLAWNRYGEFPAAVLAGYVAHMMWNMAVMKFVVAKRRKIR